MFTPFTELDAVLTDHTESVRKILRGQFVGCYLQGSFALGAGDAESDADFIVVTHTAPTDDLEFQLRRLHEAIPDRPGIWNRTSKAHTQTWHPCALCKDSAFLGCTSTAASRK